MYHFETARDVTAENSGLQRLHVAAHVGLRVHDVAVAGHFVEHLLLLVGENDVCVEGLNHEQGLAQRPRAFTQHLEEKTGIFIKMHIIFWVFDSSFTKHTKNQPRPAPWG